MAEEIEVNFRLDGNGRTLPSADILKKDSLGNLQSHAHHHYPLNYATHHCQARLSEPLRKQEDSEDLGKKRRRNSNTQSVLSTTTLLEDDLLLDCEIADSGLMPRTFWIDAMGKPRCRLEAMALDVFYHHVRLSTGTSGGEDDAEGCDNKQQPFDGDQQLPLCFDPNSSGAEWWVQIRPSPQAGRYNMHANEKEENATAKASSSPSSLAQGENSRVLSAPTEEDGISFHWDKDEELRLLCGGATYIHPHISTVTYLTSLGAPTVIFNHRVHNMTGEWLESNDNEEVSGSHAVVSWPAVGKHLAFDGRYLHAAPSNLLDPVVWQDQIRTPEEDGAEGPKYGRKQQRRRRRVTFLVNIWLNYKPFGVNPFPETMIDKMSGHGNSRLQDRHLLTFAESEEEMKSCAVSDCERIEKFEWTMGEAGSSESVIAHIPLEHIQKGSKDGQSIRLIYPRSSQDTDGGSMHPRLVKSSINSDNPLRR